MTKKSDAPAIRFKGFSDAWEQRKLASLCEKFTDGDWIESKDQSDFGAFSSNWQCWCSRIFGQA